MTNTRKTTTMRTLTAIATLATVAASAFAAVPAHPDELSYPEIRFDPPTPQEFRTEIDGVPVYMAPSAELPLINVQFTFRGGSYMESGDKIGLASMTGALMRTGGTASLSPEELDEELAFLATSAGVSVGENFASAQMNTLTANLEQSFSLFMDMVRNPGFDAERSEVLRNQTIEAMRQRNDDGLQLLLREGAFLVYGEDSPAARQPTIGTVESITEEDMRAFHAQIFHPGNLIIAVSGDFDRAAMTERLRRVLSGWARGPKAPPAPDNTHEVQPGVYYVDKEQAQGQVAFMTRGLRRDDPDAIPVRVMNDILGGSGFTSRITKRIRTDEGLAYTAGSVFRPRVEYPGDFIGYYFSKVPTVALAGRTMVEEINKIRDTEVSTDELDTVKGNIVETFPRRFESKAGTLGVFVNDEWTGRHPDHWRDYRSKVESVTPADVQRVAREYLHPDRMAMLVVGPWEGVAAGNVASEDDPARVSTMQDIMGGTATEIPIRDPLTLELPGEE